MTNSLCISIFGLLIAVILLDGEAYAGIPVMPGMSRSWDWVTGGRIARRIGDWGSVGAGYMQQRTGGELALEEVGIDAGAALGKHDDLAGKLAYDVANPGLAEATITASDRRGAWRELPARDLPPEDAGPAQLAAPRRRVPPHQ